MESQGEKAVNFVENRLYVRLPAGIAQEKEREGAEAERSGGSNAALQASWRVLEVFALWPLIRSKPTHLRVSFNHFRGRNQSSFTHKSNIKPSAVLTLRNADEAALPLRWATVRWCRSQSSGHKAFARIGNCCCVLDAAERLD